MNIKDDFILKEINDGYLVGGSVRDWIIDNNIEFVDRDISIKNAEEFAQTVAAQFEGTLITLDSENKIYRVVLKDKVNFLDISEMQGDSIEADLLRRDFTINAIAYDLKNRKFVDVTGGIDDIQNKHLRHIKDENFVDDPLRILRAFRFYATTGFSFSVELENALKKYMDLTLKPAAERINCEIMKLFGGNYAAKSLLKMEELGVLELIFPNVAEMRKVPPNTHHHLDLLHHVIETVNQIELLYEESSEIEKRHLNSIDFGGYPRINHLKLAGFLHDIGKFSTWTVEDSGRHRFIKHDDVGSKMVVSILRNMKFSKKQIDYVSSMIKNHIYPSNVIAAPELNEKVIMRYIRKMNEDVIDNIMLAKADRLSARGVDITSQMVEDNINGLNKLLNFYFDKKSTLKPLPKLLDGIEIMQIKGIKQSPNLGIIIKALQEAQLNGDINTKDEAIKFVQEYKLS